MKKKLFPVTIILSVLLPAACSKPSATISGLVANAPNAKVTLIRQGAFTQVLLDTLRTDALGHFHYNLKPSGKQFTPLFVSVSVDSSMSAMLLVEENEAISLVAAKGSTHYVVEGSKGSALLQQLNQNLHHSSHRFDSLMTLVNAEQARIGSNAKIPEKWNRELGTVYVNQYREAVRFIVKNPASLAGVAALKQMLPNGLPVFSRNEDAVYFKNVYDSLSVYYPASEYVTALRDEYERRFNQMTLAAKMETVTETGFIDIKLPDVSATEIALSSLKGHVILVYFWVSTNKEQLLFNNELKELYAKYHPKGLAIYQVALDTDKAVWSKVVADQQLPWISVCDGLGATSPAVRTYNVKSIPATYLINKTGDIVAANVPGNELPQKIGALCK